MILLFLFGTPIEALIPIGAAIVVFAELIILWSYGTLKRTRELQTTGPYGLARNPVYAGAILASIGFFILAGAGLASPKAALIPFVFRIGNLHLNAIVLPMSILFFSFFIPHYLRRIKNEEKKLAGIFGESYMNYLKRIPTRLLPFPSAFFRMDWLLFTFSMEDAFKNRVFSRIFKYGIWLVLFLGKEAFMTDINNLIGSKKWGCLQVWEHRHFPFFVAFLLGFILLHTVFSKLQNRFEPYRNR